MVDPGCHREALTSSEREPSLSVTQQTPHAPHRIRGTARHSPTGLRERRPVAYKSVVTTTPDSVHPVRRPVSEEDSRRANRADWDAYADEYQSKHGGFLGDVGFVWGPEGHQEAELQVLGPAAALAGRRVLELGSGAGQCARWLRSVGATSFGLDLSERQLQHSRRLDEHTGVAVPSICGTATQLPFADETFDVVFSSFGALQFVA